MKTQTKSLIRDIIIFAIIGISIQYIFLKNHIIKIDVLTNIVTFLSIVFGFYITSFSIFSTSTYVSGLYQITDIENKTQTLLDTLIFKYRIGVLITLFSIFYFILIIFFLNQNNVNSFSLSNKFLYPLASMFLFNLYYGYKMFEILVKIITQESKYKK
ncbi:hypothetical protein KJ854_04890 [Patescibacteria group bacterium]|nr:hypothetical protein [Patescibacteria group bacterium]